VNKIMNNSTIKIGIIAVFVFGLILGFYPNNSTYAADEFKLGGNGYSCEGNSTNRWKTETTNTATLPSGYTFDKVVVKAGQDCIEVYPTNTANTCYSININGQTVTVTKIGSGSSCQNISHLEGTWGSPDRIPGENEDPTPTPTPEVTPTVTPTTTPEGTTSTPGTVLAVATELPGTGTSGLPWVTFAGLLTGLGLSTRLALANKNLSRKLKSV
jgi:hypothetical protein